MTQERRAPSQNGRSPSPSRPERNRRNASPPPLEGPKTLMAIMAHPDDIDFTSAGTIARFCAEGWTVYYVLATSGDKGTHQDLTRQELAAMREEEQREAASVLGVKEVIFLGYPDGWVEASVELRGQIVRLLRQYKVDVVLTWDGFRAGFNHRDHRNVGIAARDAVYPAVRDHLYYEEHMAEGLEAHRVNDMLLAGSEQPDHFVDITHFIEKKVDAILCHRSQVSTLNREEMLKRQRGQGRRRGRRGNFESFKRVHIARPQRQQQSEEAPAAVHEEAPVGASQSSS
jgi:LmbE family N-acetylglucosaminyl deacetylase